MTLTDGEFLRCSGLQGAEPGNGVGAGPGKKALAAAAHPSKWQAQINSGFDALIGYASSELDRSKEVRRKSCDSSSHGGGGGGVSGGAGGGGALTPPSAGSNGGGGGGDSPSGSAGTVHAARSKSARAGASVSAASSAPESVLRAALSGACLFLLAAPSIFRVKSLQPCGFLGTAEHGSSNSNRVA